ALVAPEGEAVPADPRVGPARERGAKGRGRARPRPRRGARARRAPRACRHARLAPPARPEDPGRGRKSLIFFACGAYTRALCDEHSSSPSSLSGPSHFL